MTDAGLLTYLVYLFYGMAFFAMGVAITSRDTSASSLDIGRFLWVFALFAYSHALHEWSDLYLLLAFPRTLLPPLPVFWLKLILVFVSFGLLFAFGFCVLRAVLPRWRRILAALPPLCLIAWFCSLSFVDGDNTAVFRAMVDFRLRNFIGFPAAMLTAWAFWAYAVTVRDISRKGARSFAGAGIAVAVYGVLTGFIPSGTSLPPLSLPVELLRGMTAFVILHFLMRALQTFDVARNLKIEDSLTRFAQSEKLHALGRMAFGIAHEINTPLTNISLGVELLKQEVGDGERLSKRFEGIERNLDRASKIAGELLHFASNRDVELTPTDLKEVIESTLHLLGTRRKSYHIETRLNPIPEIMGIPWKLEEVFLNLLINAMDALPEGGTIIISTQAEPGRVVAEVCDSGTGIQAELLGRVFDPFFTTKEVGKGTGLGLAICYGIMEMHSGSIELESTPGQGTCVRLIFSREESDESYPDRR